MATVISWDNYVDDATITNSSPGVLASPQTATEALAASKLQNRQLGDIFRQTFTSIGSPLPQLILDFDLGSAKATDLIGILNHNMAGMAYTINFGTSQGASDVGQETGTFWTGITDDAKNEFIYLTSGHTARYVRLIVSCSSTPVDIGRVWLDDAWDVKLGFDFSLGIDDTSNMSESRGGSVYATARKRRRVLNCRAVGTTTEDIIGTDAATASLLSMDVSVGQHGEVIVLPQTTGSGGPSDQRTLNRLGVYGHLYRNDPIEFSDKSGSEFVCSKRFSVKEDF